MKKNLFSSAFSGTTFRAGFTSVAVSLALAACGGGGGGGDTAVVEPPVTPEPPAEPAVVPVFGNLVTSVSPALYSGAGAAAKARGLAYINKARSTCGFGMLQQNASLDTSGSNHAVYYELNGREVPHDEKPGNPGFTGVGPSERAAYAGYLPNAVVGENGSFSGGTYNTDYFSTLPRFVDPDVAYYDMARNIVHQPYHGFSGVFSPAVDFGYGSHINSSVSGNMTTTHINVFYEFGHGANPYGQLPAINTGVRTYPCDGIDDVLPGFWGEWLPSGEFFYDGRIANTNPTSSPIYVFSDYGKKLTINSAEIKDMTNGESLPIYTIRTKDNDPVNAHYHTNESGFIMANTPFIPNHTYKVTIKGFNGSNAFEKIFQFKAGKHTAGQEDTIKALNLPVPY